ncbi:MAG TPA: heavy metal translocating P-type ATPase, partial [Tepidisphaeraceae bacterium]|nr:heavy metal translocating P-type ATPase [Tepidisphaeraceae bacterium]
DRPNWLGRLGLIDGPPGTTLHSASLGLRGGMPIWLAMLLLALAVGGTPLVFELFLKLIRRQFGSDLLAGISIVTAVILGQYLAGTFVVLMLSGGEALECYAVRSASSVLESLARRMPTIAHLKRDNKREDVALDRVAVGDSVMVLPHEICPVDGIVLEGHGVMDESYLTGEPYQLPKAPGSAVISGALNGETMLEIRASRIAADSRYAKIVQVMRASEQDRPRIRRLGDKLGAIYTPIAVAIAIAAWLVSGDATRFLAVLVVATPCPLLIAIPVAVIGSISLAARIGIIVKKPVVLEQISTCRTMIFDKTGTLTYGQPALSERITAPGFTDESVLSLAASLEKYSKHPLAGAVLIAAENANVALDEPTELSERPGQGLSGFVSGHRIEITSREKCLAQCPSAKDQLPPPAGGMECIIMIEGAYAATFSFRDEIRAEGRSFVNHLRPRHHIQRMILLSGDRQSEVAYLAKQVGITEAFYEKSPEEKLQIVQREAAAAPTIFVGDGINDAPALSAATVGVAIGQKSDITSEAAGVVILDSSLRKVDEFLHVGRRMWRIALQSAVGGMALSIFGMIVASMGYLPPVAGAITQEIIDVIAVVNALRVAIPPRSLSDF